MLKGLGGRVCVLNGVGTEQEVYPCISIVTTAFRSHNIDLVFMLKFYFLLFYSQLKPAQRFGGNTLAVFN